MFPKLANHIISYKISNLLKRDRDLNKLKSTPPEDICDASPQVSAFLEKKIFRRIFSTYFLACKKFDIPPLPSVPHSNPEGYDLNKLKSKLFEDAFQVSAFLGKWFWIRF